MNEDSQPDNAEGAESLKKQLAAAQQTVSRLIDADTDEVVTREEFESRFERARKRQSILETMNDRQSQAREHVALREALECIDSFADTIRDHLKKQTGKHAEKSYEHSSNESRSDQMKYELSIGSTSPFFPPSCEKTEK